MATKETLVSIDIEADGPIPGEYSMLSLGAAAILPEGCNHRTFYATIEPLPDAHQHPDTMDWWLKQPKAWQEVTSGMAPPLQVMTDFQSWLKTLPSKPVLCGYPVAWDFSFVHWYWWKFLKTPPPFGHSALDIKTVAMQALSKTYSNSAKSQFPKRWFVGTERELAHRAVDDAIAQAVLLQNILKEIPK